MLSSRFAGEDVNSFVFNVPEILTRSSKVFPGVEIPLYTLLGALKKSGGKKGEALLLSCLQKMESGALATVMDSTSEYFLSPANARQSVFEKWPQHNTKEHIEQMLETSKKLSLLHKESSQNITPLLSEAVLKSTGDIMLDWLERAGTSGNEGNATDGPPPGNSRIKGVYWIGHQSVAAKLS